MALPPSIAGALQVRETSVFPAVPDTPVGASGVVAGVTLELSVLKLPVPTSFTAATLKIYAVPFVSPVTVAEVKVDVPSANGVQVVPLSDEYSTS